MRCVCCRGTALDEERLAAVVLGARPAGAACAISLARQGFTVDVLVVRRSLYGILLHCEWQQTEITPVQSSSSHLTCAAVGALQRSPDWVLQ